MERGVLYVKIEYENGLYVLKNDLICSEIPNNININTPFFLNENSFEEIIDTILEEEEEYIIFLYTSKNQTLVQKLGEKLLDITNRTIIFIGEQLKDNYQYIYDNKKIYLLCKFDYLENMEKINFIECNMIPKIYDPLDDENSNRYYITMKNGCDAFFTGIYPENLSNTLSKHIYINSEMNIRNIEEKMDINGAIFVDEGKERLDLCEPINHIHTIKKDRIQFDNFQDEYRVIICNYTEFFEWREKGNIDNNTTYFLKIENESDLECLKEELEEFRKNASIHMIQTRLIDECRWSNHCSLKRLVRYSIYKNKIVPCLTSSQHLLGIEEDIEEQHIEANRLYDRTIIDRKCSKCHMKFKCSKCACLPQNINQELYCKMMMEYPFILEYLEKKRVLNMLKSASKFLENVDDLKISSSVHCLEYPASEEKNIAEHPIYIFCINKEYFYLHILKGIIIKIERKYVFLLEAWMLNIKEEEICRKMEIKYNFDPLDVKHLVKEGYENLRRWGMIS